jgi:uncharacterized membrane protein YbhN (UPF0104 family)
VRIPVWFQILVSIAVLGIVLWHVPVEKLLVAAQSADLIWLLAALATTLAMLSVRHVKWYRLLRAAGLPVAPKDSLRSLLCGFALSVPTPGRLGEFGRCLFLPEGMRSQVFQLNILERVLDAWAIFTFAVASLTVIQLRPRGAFALAVWLAVLPVFLGMPGLLSSLSERRIWRGNLGVHLREGSRALAGIRAAPFAGWSLLTTSLDLLIFYFLLQAFHHTVFPVALTVFPWMIIAGSLPIAVGGIGPREGVAAFLLARHAVPAAAGTDAALFVFILSAVFPAACGAVWMAFRRFRGSRVTGTQLESLAPEA